MGEPIRIVELARSFIRLSGTTEKDVPIVYTGLRPGEKRYEELFYSTEDPLPTPHEKVRRTHSNLALWTNLTQQLRELQEVMQSGSIHSMRAKIQDIVPEYTYVPTSGADGQPGPATDAGSNLAMELAHAAVAATTRQAGSLTLAVR